MDSKIDLERASLCIENFLEALGIPVGSDPELQHTGIRVAEAFANELLAGYRMDPSEILKDRTASGSKGLVVMTDVLAHPMCPHHLLPARGVIHLGYLPQSAVVGLGALAKLADCFSQRLVLQEDLAERIANSLVEHLQAKGAACMVDLEPMCVCARGVRKANARAISTAFAGSMAETASERQEFLTAVAGRCVQTTTSS